MPRKRSRNSKPLPWRTCPACKSRASKIFNLNTWLYECQICDHKYSAPTPGALSAVALTVTVGGVKVPSVNKGKQR